MIVRVLNLGDVLAQALQVVNGHLLEDVLAQHRFHDWLLHLAEKSTRVGRVLLGDDDVAVVVDDVADLLVVTARLYAVLALHLGKMEI